MSEQAPESILRFDPKPGDIVVVCCEAFLSERARSELEARVKAACGDHEVLILDGGAQLALLRPTKKSEPDGPEAAHPRVPNND